MLMDIHMPDTWTDLKPTSSIRARERFTGSRTPISGRNGARRMTGDRDKCLAAGMDAYVFKAYSQGGAS